MQVTLLQNDGSRNTAGVDVADAIFAQPYNEALVHQVIVAYHANARSGNRAQKDRAEVHHSTRKPWRQKGTGRARAGMSSSPLWRGGGKTFPNSPDENFSQKVNKKSYRVAVRSIYSLLAKENRLIVVDDFAVDAPKTRLVAEKLKQWNLESVLIVTHELSEALYLASRNLANVAVLEVKSVDPVSLLHYRNVVVTRAAVQQIEELLG